MAAVHLNVRLKMGPYVDWQNFNCTPNSYINFRFEINKYVYFVNYSTIWHEKLWRRFKDISLHCARAGLHGVNKKTLCYILFSFLCKNEVKSMNPIWARKSFTDGINWVQRIQYVPNLGQTNIQINQQPYMNIYYINAITVAQG